MCVCVYVCVYLNTFGCHKVVAVFDEQQSLDDAKTASCSRSCCLILWYTTMKNAFRERYSLTIWYVLVLNAQFGWHSTG